MACCGLEVARLSATPSSPIQASSPRGGGGAATERGRAGAGGDVGAGRQLEAPGRPWVV